MTPAPLYDEFYGGPPGGAAHWVTTADGLRIRIAHWTGEGTGGTILMFPGRTEFLEKYGRAAEDFLARGYASVAIDWRGQGLSDRMLDDRLRGHVVHFQDYQQDVAAAMGHARALGLPEPFYLLAHSLGGGIGLRALMAGLPVRAAAFSAPMWGIAMPTHLRPMAWPLAWGMRVLGLGDRYALHQQPLNYVLRGEFAGNTLTGDAQMWDNAKAQLIAYPDLALGGPSYRWLSEALLETWRLNRLPSPDYPCLTFLGTGEAIVSADRIRDRMARWPGGTLHVLEGAMHELLTEVPALRNQVIEGAADHFDAYR